MRLVISIINYRTPSLIVDCLSSLQSQVEIDRDLVVVVDNASGDDSIEQIQKAITENHWESWVKLLPSPVNGGFSAGHNLVLQGFTAQAYLILGSDTLVRPGAIAALLDAMQTHPEAGFIGPRLEWPDATPQISCFRYRSPIEELIGSACTGPVTKLLKNYEVILPVSDTPIEPQWLSFACVLLRREVIEQIGPMDEGYFMYFEDIDYSRRAQSAGWKMLYWPQARVVHLKGGSGPVQASVAARKRPPAYLYASRSRYFTKFYGPIGLWMANACWLTGRSISLARELVGNKQPHTCDKQAQDIWMNWRNPMQPPALPGR
jgi:N-acetylglucosaminyl-diphospho-decaprenol L-rhamnosyltransferase